MKMPAREDAFALLNEWVKSDSLRKHCLGVAVCMEEYARKFLEEGKIINETNNQLDINANSNGYNKLITDKWFFCGLLHDFDYEKFPDIEVHPIEGCKALRKKGYDEEIIEAILGHNEKTGIQRKSLMAKTLFAVDELSGLIVALAKVREGNFEGMSAKSVRKAMKKKDFAAAINREDINKGMEELGFDTEDKKNEHFETLIKALEKNKEKLGF